MEEYPVLLNSDFNNFDELNNFNLLENFKIDENNSKEFKCEECSKKYRKKQSLKRHINNKHKETNLLSLRLTNDNLKLQIKLYTEQIKFLKRLAFMQDYTLHRYKNESIPILDKAK